MYNNIYMNLHLPIAWKIYCMRMLGWVAPKERLHRRAHSVREDGRWRASFGDRTQRLTQNNKILDLQWQMKVLFVVALITSMVGCAIFRPHHTTDDSLLDFYSTEPAAHTKASLRLTEKARSEISPTSYTTAIDTLNKALSIDPQNPFAYYFLAYVYHQKDDYKKSNGFLEKAKQLFSDFPFWKAKSYELSSLNFEKLGDKQKAKLHLKKAKEIYPNL